MIKCIVKIAVWTVIGAAGLVACGLCGYNVTAGIVEIAENK